MMPHLHTDFPINTNKRWSSSKHASNIWLAVVQSKNATASINRSSLQEEVNRARSIDKGLTYLTKRNISRTHQIMSFVKNENGVLPIDTSERASILFVNEVIIRQEQNICCAMKFPRQIIRTPATNKLVSQAQLRAPIVTAGNTRGMENVWINRSSLPSITETKYLQRETRTSRTKTLMHEQRTEMLTTRSTWWGWWIRWEHTGHVLFQW